MNNYNSNYQNNGSNKSMKKHSGAKTGTYVPKSWAKYPSDHKKTGYVPYVRGWNYSRRHGMRVFLCTPYSKTKRVKSSSGKSWENWMVTIKQDGNKDVIVSGMYDVNSRKVIIDDLSMVINPSAPKGGYCGRYYQGRN